MTSGSAGASSSSYVDQSYSDSNTPNNAYQPDSSAHTAMPASVARQIFDSDLIQQSSAYGMDGQGAPNGAGALGAPKPAVVRRPVVPGQKRETVIRKGNGKTWEDPTLVDWDPGG